MDADGMTTEELRERVDMAERLATALERIKALQEYEPTEDQTKDAQGHARTLERIQDLQEFEPTDDRCREVAEYASSLQAIAAR